MSNEVKQDKKELAVVYEVDGEQIKLTPKIVQDYIVGTDAQITMPEFKMFTALCKARKLNPFLKEVYCIKYGSQPAQLVVSKDIILRRAVLHPDYNGIEDGIIVLNADGEIIERKGCFKLPTETLVGGWARVYRKNWEHPTYCSVSFDEVAQKKKDGSLNSNWSGKAATMVNKVAKVRALRETFVEEFAGMYDESEFNVPEPVKDNAIKADIIEQSEPIETTATTVNDVVSMDEI